MEDTDVKPVETNEDINDNEPVNLEDMEVTEDELKQIEESEDDSEELEDESKDKSEETNESDNTDEVESDESEKDVESDEEKQKAFNKQMAEKRIAEKRQREEAIRQQQQSYIDETEDPLEAATRQNQVELYNIKVENLTNKLTNSYEKAIKDFNILSNQTPEVKEMVDEAIDTFQALYVPVDAYGNPKEVKADFYQYLQNKANSIEKLTGIKAKQQEDNKIKEKSKTITPPSRQPKEAKKDKDIEAFWEEARK